MNQNTDPIQTSEISEFAERFINQTNRSIFLTGKAGTGKTTLLRKLVRSTHKQAVIVAPTGIAALNAGGVTIHSFFQLPLRLLMQYTCLSGLYKTFPEGIQPSYRPILKQA